MDVLEAIRTRRSIRSYIDVPVEWDKITTVVEAGMMAPSAGNLQVWRFAIIRGAGKRDQIAQACLQQHWMAQAPVHIAIFAKLEKEEQFYGIRGTRLYCIQDCAMAAMSMMLAAKELGLGTCFVSAFEEEAMSRIFKLPPNVRPQGIITLGYSEERPNPPIRFRVESIIGVENYGTAMNEGRGRVVDPAVAVHTMRYAEHIPRYVQDAVKDVSKVITKRGFLARWLKKLREEREKNRQLRQLREQQQQGKKN